MAAEVMGLDGPLRAASYDAIRAGVALSREDPMSDLHNLAIDLAKRSFPVCGTDRGGAVLFNHTLWGAKLPGALAFCPRIGFMQP